MADPAPGLFVEAAERILRAAGYHTIRRYRSRAAADFDAILVAHDVDAPATVIQAEHGRIALADILLQIGDVRQ